MLERYSHRQRLSRAWQHLQSFDAERGRWLASEPYSFTDEFDPQTRENVVRIHVSERPPASLALITGDCIHNLRSSLDHLVYELARAHKGNRLSKSIAGDSGFPIFSTPEGFAGKTAQRMIRGIAPGAKAAIERLQPYRTDSYLNNTLLGTLNELSRIDKHRLPPLTLFWHKGSTLDGHNAIVRTAIEHEAGLIENGAELARYRATPASPEYEMRVDFKFFFDIAFAEAPCKGEQVRVMLWWFHHHIGQEVIPRLQQFINFPQ